MASKGQCGNMLKRIPKEGDRVKVVSLNIKGTIDYINTASLYIDHEYPIQVDCDSPWDDNSTQTIYRTNLRDLRALKKKVKK
jgi:hypothetical protein